MDENIFLGRFDLHKYTLKCEVCHNVLDPFTLDLLLLSDFWPGSPRNISYIIKISVFSLWDAFRKRMPGSSERSFLQALADIGIENGRVCN